METQITYNEMCEELGEDMYLAYESLVGRIIEGNDYTIEVMRIAHYSPNLLEAQKIIEKAKVHAAQEIKESEAR